MKNILSLIFLLSTFLIFSCTSSNESSKKETTDTSSTVEVVEVETTNPAEENSKSFSIFETPFYYEGTMNEKIHISLWISKKNNLVSGELTYKKSGIPIKIKGMVDNEGYYYVTEFDKNGNITGVLDFKLNGDSLNGKWFSPASQKSFVLNMLKKTPVTPVIPDFTAASIEGEYKFDYGKEGAGGKVKIKKISDDKIIIDLHKHNPPPGYHLAIMEGDTLSLSGNSATYKNIDGEFMKCNFQIDFYKDFIYISYLNNNSECGFGANAYIDGIYFKTK